MYQYAPLPAEMVKSSDLLGETNDCTVKALAISMNTTYEKARYHLSVHCGRKPRHGIRSREMLPKSLKNTPHKVGPYSRSNRITIGRFCREHPVGRYYVAVAGHALAIVDGVVYDHSDKPRRHIIFAMRVYPKEN